VSLLSAAVHNNAMWCDAVCGALGCDTTRLDAMWINRSPAPPYYSNAVTLERFKTASQLARVRSMLEWSLPRPWTVKDSFRVLDLAPLGFEVLFEAEWIALLVEHQPGDAGSSALTWKAATADADLVEWERIWRGDNPDAPPIRVFQPALLDDPDIRFLAAMQDGRVVAEAIVNRSDDGTEPVVGISNLVPRAGDPRTDVRGLIGAVREAFPGLPVVGYERGVDLIAMRGAGFRSLGPLRVWSTPARASTAG
jgi:hypothetical protein